MEKDSIDAIFAVVLFFLAVSVGFFLIMFKKFYATERSTVSNHERRVIQSIRIDPTSEDRQGNIFTISAEGEANRNYGEFYVIEPNSDDTRVRAQVEKDDKDLPTYEEVMAATLAASAAACGVVVGAGSTTSLGVASANGEARDTTITINAPSSTNIPIDVPPYSEVDPNPVPSISNINFNESSVLTDCNSASATSRTQTDLTVSLPMGTESITTTSSSNSTASSPHMTLTAIHNEPSTSQNIVVPLPAVINSQDSSAA